MGERAREMIEGGGKGGQHKRVREKVVKIKVTGILKIYIYKGKGMEPECNIKGVRCVCECVCVCVCV